MLKLRGKLLWLLGAVMVMAALLVLTLAMPVPMWRTGRMAVRSLDLVQGGPSIAMAPRLWIDTDAACGLGERTDPDDCLALALLIPKRSGDIVGVSTVFGNASLEETDRVARDLIGMMSGEEGTPAIPVFAGASAAGEDGTSASRALQAALAQGPMTVLSIGPLTNVAAALAGRPGLQANVSRLVVVMGKRRGHIFHPAEGHGGAMFLGHGPVFRDFNLAADPAAAAKIVAMRLPMTLVPYDAARHVIVSDSDLDRIEKAGQALSWVADRARGWLGYWRRDVGTDGFYPFDLVAAGYVLDPGMFNCASSHAVVEPDRSLFTSWLWKSEALLVAADRAGAPVIYCPSVAEDLGHHLMSMLTDRTASTM